ncbi:jg9671 [Pararge aegeria aegeria]|uniref:Jg9671 protein n=1 Tax=Pararge aegeria aegeria TaxID=348720 RepID=A0A8S4RST8_9NEOP|nr:jg9671 [Pararge aegeria aegeria]
MQYVYAHTSACTHLRGIAALQARPPNWRPLPRELLLSPLMAPVNAGIGADKEDDALVVIPKPPDLQVVLGSDPYGRI